MESLARMFKSVWASQHLKTSKHQKGQLRQKTLKIISYKFWLRELGVWNQDKMRFRSSGSICVFEELSQRINLDSLLLEADVGWWIKFQNKRSWCKRRKFVIVRAVQDCHGPHQTSHGFHPQRVDGVFWRWHIA